MAETPSLSKHKVNLQTHLHSLNVQFGSSAVQKLASLPPLYIRLTCGSHSIKSAKVSLVVSSSKASTYNAYWEGETLSLPIATARQTASGIFESRHLKLALKIYSEGKSSHKTLASHNFDVASLNLTSLDFAGSSKERHSLVFTIGKNATSSIACISLDVTFQYSYLHDHIDRPHEEPTPDVTSQKHSSSSPVLPQPDVQRWSMSPSPEVETQLLSVQLPHEVQGPFTHPTQSAQVGEAMLLPQHETQGSSLQLHCEEQAPCVLPGLEITRPSTQPQDELQRPSISSMVVFNHPSKHSHESMLKHQDVTKQLQETPPNLSHFHTSMEVSKIAAPATDVVKSTQATKDKEQGQGVSKVVKFPPPTCISTNETQKGYSETSVAPTGSQISHPDSEKPNETRKLSLSSMPESEAVDGPTCSSHIPVVVKQHKSKARKLKGFFKIKGPKTKPKSTAAAKAATKATANQVTLTQHFQKATPPSTVGYQKPTELSFEEFRKVVTRPKSQLYATSSNCTTADSGVSLKDEESERPQSQERANGEHSVTSLPAESSIIPRGKPDTFIPPQKPKHKSGLVSVPQLEKLETKDAIMQGSIAPQDNTDQVTVTPESSQPAGEKAPMKVTSFDISGNTGQSSVLPPKCRRVSEPIISNRAKNPSPIPLPSDIPMKSKRTNTPVQSPSQPPLHAHGNHKPQERSPQITKLLSGSTPVLQSGSASSYSKKYSSISDLTQPKTSSDRRPSIGDLVRPTRNSTVENLIQQKARSDQNLHGILKIHVSGVNVVSNELQGPQQSLTDMVFSPEKNQKAVGSQQLPTEGLFCVFTINGGNSRAETSVQPIVPRRPLIWSENEELLFHTSQSRQVFIMCRKTKLDSSKGSELHTISEVGMKKSKVKNDVCIGAAVLSIADMKAKPIVIDSSTTNVPQVINRQQYDACSLPLQPQGSMLLKACFCAWTPNLKVSCKGTVTLQSLVGVDSHPNHDLSCTVRIDSEFQDCTTVLTSEECATEGWKDEPIEFNAYCSMHCDVQIWAYSSEETEYWCGGCIVPLALTLPAKTVENYFKSSNDNDGLFVVTEPYERTLTLPVEPKGILTISFLLYPSPRSSPVPVTSDEDERAGANHDPATSSDVSSKASSRQVSFSPDCVGDPDSSSNITRCGSLRKTMSSTLRKAGGFSLKVRKSYTEEPFILQQENTDLKREVTPPSAEDSQEVQMTPCSVYRRLTRFEVMERYVEYLREQLRETKANLAESEFFREKLQLELRTAQEELEHLIKERPPSKGSKTTQKFLNKNSQK